MAVKRGVIQLQTGGKGSYGASNVVDLGLTRVICQGRISAATSTVLLEKPMSKDSYHFNLNLGLKVSLVKDV